ncbi:hypothetical protein HN385_04895 [archaeon]|jgi:hypothetical protein|nr:hypothetical protein [archaeon]MBT3451304.1 hypothetical protein [archaeon]MBT6869294.1 hypothetical protein [archaeon]MBT7381196.1 hypothetical protein [archaeon]MBT7508555.1 hypothetical protein [archaeon]
MSIIEKLLITLCFECVMVFFALLGLLVKRKFEKHCKVKRYRKLINKKMQVLEQIQSSDPMFAFRQLFSSNKFGGLKK